MSRTRMFTPEQHRVHLTDGLWHDDCFYCLARRRVGGTGVCECGDPAGHYGKCRVTAERQRRAAPTPPAEPGQEADAVRHTTYAHGAP